MSWLFFISGRNDYFYASKPISLSQFQASVTNTTGQFPNETYLNGLRDNPESTLAVVYDEFRKPAIGVVTALGGSPADGAVFFQAAANDAVRLARAGQAPTHIPVFEWLKALSLAHYRDWLQERGQPAPPQNEAAPEGAFIPDSAALRDTRLKMFAWKRLHWMDYECRQYLLQQAQLPAPAEQTEAEAEAEHSNKENSCTAEYLTHLQNSGTPFTTLPDWARSALLDQEGYAVWQRSHTLENQWSAGAPIAQESGKIWPWAIAALLLAAVGYGAYQFFQRPHTAAEVFADNFSPPPSLLEDLDARYGAEMGNDSVTARPNQCMLLLQEADAYYRVKEFESALDPLLLIVLDSNSICQSDAWYFLGIIHLELEDPTTAIQCFAKIDDLTRYGEDLYWYQALAFVQLAKENPLMRDKARRAVERALGNTQDAARREQAEKMLHNLSK